MRVGGPSIGIRKICANAGSNVVVLRFGDHGTKEMLGLVSSNV